MARVLDRLIAPKAPIDIVRRHGAEEFHGSSMEESEKAEFWLEKLERVLEEVRFPPDQRASCAISLLPLNCDLSIGTPSGVGQITRCVSCVDASEISF